MSDWKETTLGEVLNFRRGHDLPKTEMIDGNIPVAGSNGIIGWHNEATNISPCLTIGRSGSVGKPYFYDKAWAHNTVLYIDDFKGNNPKFLFYLIQTLPLAEYQAGSAVPTLNRNHIHPLPIKFPTTLAEQEKIAGILSSLDDKIETNRAINARLEELAAAIFKSWFIDFEPFADGEFIEDQHGRRPKGWEVGPIYNIVNVIYGAPYSSELFNEKKQGLPLIRIRDLKTCSPQFYTTETLPKTEYVLSGDIVAGMDAEFIPYMWHGEKGVLNQRCCKFTAVDDRISNGFILNFMYPLLYFIQSYKTGTTVSHLGKSDLDKIITIIPPINEIHKFSVATKNIYSEICRRYVENARLAALRDALLPRLMSGELIPE